jgi:hypothetical protein
MKTLRSTTSPHNIDRAPDGANGRCWTCQREVIAAEMDGRRVLVDEVGKRGDLAITFPLVAGGAVLASRLGRFRSRYREHVCPARPRRSHSAAARPRKVRP